MFILKVGFDWIEKARIERLCWKMGLIGLTRNELSSYVGWEKTWTRKDSCKIHLLCLWCRWNCISNCYLSIGQATHWNLNLHKVIHQNLKGVQVVQGYWVRCASVVRILSEMIWDSGMLVVCFVINQCLRSSECNCKGMCCHNPIISTLTIIYRYLYQRINHYLPSNKVILYLSLPGWHQWSIHYMG